MLVQLLQDLTGIFKLDKLCLYLTVKGNGHHVIGPHGDILDFVHGLLILACEPISASLLIGAITFQLKQLGLIVSTLVLLLATDAILARAPNPQISLTIDGC